MSGTILMLVGLLVELSAVTLMATSSMTKMRISRFFLADSKKVALALAAGSLAVIPTLAWHFWKLWWPWFVWGLCVLAWLMFLPAIFAYADYFSKAIGEPRDEEKVDQLQVQGLFMLGAGLSLQTLATLLNP
jgi:hypothetical protein